MIYTIDEFIGRHFTEDKEGLLPGDIQIIFSGVRRDNESLQ